MGWTKSINQYLALLKLTFDLSEFKHDYKGLKLAEGDLFNLKKIEHLP